MKVILLTELKGKGGEGDVVEVARGFANNYLFPKKFAVEATKGNLKQLEQRRDNIAKREADRIADATALKEKMEGRVVKIEAKVGEEGQLFGSVTPQMIAAALAEEAGIDIDRKRIDLKSAIKVAGEHEVVVSLYREIKTTMKVLVGSDEPAAEEAAEELKTTEDAIAVEAGAAVAAADAAGDEKAAAEAAETVAEVNEAEQAE